MLTNAWWRGLKPRRLLNRGGKCATSVYCAVSFRAKSYQLARYVRDCYARIERNELQARYILTLR
jgi:hypothetical protein